jgi:SAM-dependent methyltransferase
MNEAKFNGMGKTYAKFRPTYPQAFIEYLRTDVGVTKNRIIADIGSGTGILTKQLLELGNRVIAVEPNEDMRVVAESDLCGYENFTSVNGSAENTTLDSQSVDFITVAQAFHWFDRELFKAECRRVFKPNGKIILVWNSRIFGTEVVEDGDKINKKYCPNFKGFSGSMRGVLYNATGVENTNAFNDFFVGEYDVKVFENNQTLDLDGFIGRNRSASYALKEGDKNYPAYISELTECFNRHAVDGKLIMPNETRSYVGAVK